MATYPAANTVVNIGFTGYTTRVTPVPDRPAFATPLTKTAAQLIVAGQLFRQDFGAASDTDGKDLLLSGSFTLGLSPNSLKGNPKPFRVSNVDNNTIIGNAARAPGSDTMDQVSSCTNFEIHGKSESEPFVITSQGSAINFSSASVAGTIFKCCNVFTQNTGYAGALINVGGGSNVGNGWNGTTYKKILVRFWRSRGNYAEGEGLYFGHTSSPYATITELVLLQAHIMDKGREPFQIEHCSKVLCYNGTSYFTGNSGLGGQTNLIQIHDSNGTIENWIFDGAPNLWNLFTHGFTFRNCYFRWTNGLGGFIGNTDSSYFGPVSTNPRLNGLLVLFDNCVFHADTPGNVATLTDVAERFCNFEFRNCQFSTNILALYNDQRGASPPNLLIGTPTSNGNTYVNWTRPEYAHFDITEHKRYGTVTNYNHVQRGMGWKTPLPGVPLDICEIDEVYDFNVPLGTLFTSINLPSTLETSLQDGWKQTQGIVWNPGSYNGSVPGTYPVTGDIIVPNGRRNTTNIVARTNIIVT